MKKYIFALFLIFSISCLYEGNGIDYLIKNTSEHPVTKVKFYTSERVNIAVVDSINAQGRSSGWLSMKKNKGDGNYILEFQRHNGKIEKHSGGYYTNKAISRFIEFEIQNDTVLFK